MRNNGCGKFVYLQMHPNIAKLNRIAQQPTRMVLGLMSGTSLDGLDMALCKISGAGNATQLELIKQTTTAYSATIRETIQSVFSKQEISLERLTVLHPWLAIQHAHMINEVLAEWGIKAAEIDLIASHGQTIFHAPKKLHPNTPFGNATLQIVEADHLAVYTGIITISDFRQKHIAKGGEGAPLAIYGDYILAKHTTENRVLLNIGGIANFTYLPAAASFDQIQATDTGPGNTLMDQYAQKYFAVPFDKGGQIASKGKINQSLLEALLAAPFFNWAVPKTIGPELFNLQFIDQAVNNCSFKQPISKEDVIATLNEFTASSIVQCVQATIPLKEKYTIYVSGGGLHNPVLINSLKNHLPNVVIESAADIGIHADAKEAILFALLANEHVAGSGESMGKISFP